MSKQKLGFALYVSSFKEQQAFLEKMKGQNIPIFTSLHITEEMKTSYIEKVEVMCDWLYENKFWVMADVSPVTLERFEEDSLASLAHRLHLDNLRLDFGFDNQEFKSDVKDLTFSYNASTILDQNEVKSNAFYMHNFYPRPETGLDVEFFSSLNRKIKKNTGKVLAFIAGDGQKRGPIFEGLPTLEAHRYLSPYAQFVDLVNTYQIDQVFLGDIKMSDNELKLIVEYMEDQLIRIPVKLPQEYEYLYQHKYTVRVDSPSTLVRVQESREYARKGPVIEPANQVNRERGSVTIDNKAYRRYSGEVQITKRNYPKDERVNVIASIDKKYHLLLDNLSNGDNFMFVAD